MLRLPHWWIVPVLLLLSACDTSFTVSGIDPSNTAPLGADASVTTTEDTPVMASLSVSDPDSDPLTIAVTDDVDNGVLTIVADGSGGFDASYEPNPDFNGTDEFVFTVSDQALTAGPFTVTITVSAENDAPAATAQTINGGEDMPLIGASVTATDVDGDALTFVSVTLPTNGTLALNADGSFSYTPNANFNGADQFSFTASDGTLDSNTAVVTINVASANDAPVAAADAFMATEDVPLSIAAPGLLANDMDIDGDALTAAIASPPANGVVNIAADGSFVYMPNADFNGTDTFTYVANDGTVASPPATATISVAAVNDIPVANGGGATSAEDAFVDLMLTGSDVENDALTFAIVGGPSSGVVSGFNTATGALTYTPNADFSGDDSFMFRANDGMADSADALVTITVTPVNDAPTDIAIDNAVIAEEQPAGTAVGTLSSVDVDAGDTHTYTLVAGAGDTDNASFATAGNQLQTAVILDFETQASFSVRVQTDDGNGGSFEAAIAITVTDANDTPTDIALSNANVDENQPAGTAVGTLTTTDQDTADTHAYTLVAGAGDADNASFAIVGDELQTAAVLDFETQNSFSVRVQTDDGAGGTYEESLTITANDINEAPTDVSLSNSSVDENLPAGTAVGTLSSTDADSAGPFTYSLVAGAGDTDNGSFSIVGDQLQTAASFDFETQSSFSVRVSTDDGAGGTFEEALTITVNDVNDPPTDIALDNSDVDENQPAGTPVGTLSSSDADSPGPFVYALVAGAGDTDNASFSIVGDQLQTAASFDFETQSSFAIRLQTDDGAGGTFEEAFTITVNDVNDPPTDIALDSSDVDENQPSGTPVGTFTSSDVDSAGPFVYALVAGAGDTDNASFSIVGDQLRTAAVFDFETQNSFSVRVRTDDGAGGTFEEVLTIIVNDANEAPTDISLSNSSVDENLPAGTAVGTLSSTDVDSAGPFTYALVAGAGDTDNAAFAIVGDQLQTAAVFDFEVQNSFAIRVRTDDGTGGTFEEAFTITVNDDNDPPTDIALDSTDVDENQPAGTPVGTLTSTDADSPGPFGYSLVAGAGDTDNASFAIVGDQLRTAEVFDASVQNSYSVRIQTDDGAGGIFEEAFTITVNGLNSLPTDISIDSSNVDENQIAGTLVGTFTTTDPDPDTFVYTLVAGAGGTDNAQFTISGDQLLTNAVLNFEATDNCVTSASTCAIRVQTDDQVSGTFQETIVINITDLNDPPVAADDSYTGAIGNTQLALVAALSGTPPFPATVEMVGSVGDNDPDEDGDTVGAVAGTVATMQGGSVTIDAAGRFVYQPPAGFTGGNDTFTYTPFDGTDSSASTATVTIGVTGIVWYVDDSSPNAPGTGTSADPFRSLSSAGPGPTLPGETIFVYAGTQTTGITLQNNQSLLGEGVALVVGPTTLSSAGTRPVITTAGTAITLGMSNTVRGIDISGSNSGIVGTSGGTLTADTMSISTNGGPGIDLINGAGLVTFDSVSSTNSSSEGIDLNSVSGTFTFGSGTITGSTTNAFEVSNSSAVIEYSGSISAGSGRAVSIVGHSANSVSLTGAINSSAQGIALINNSGGTINFRGGISLSTGLFEGISARNGGTLNICADTNCGAGGGTAVVNSINTTNAIALKVDNVDIGTDGLTFESIACTNSTSNGIVLDTTGTLGGLTVTGDGSTTLGGNDSGGIIQNTSGDGISLISTRDVTLQNMTIGDPSATPANLPDAIGSIAGDGIEATGVTNLTLQSVTIARSGDHGLNAVSIASAPSVTNLVVDDSLILNAGDGNEHGLNLDELRGDNFVRDSLFDAFNETGIEVVNTSGTVDLTISNTTFQDNKATVLNLGEEAILLEAQGSATIVVLVTGGSVFDDIATQAIQALSIGSTSMIHLTVENSTFVEHSSGDGIIIMNPDGGGSGNVTVRGNIFNDDTFGPFAVIAKNDSSGTLDATIQSNTVTSMQLLNVNHDDIGGAGAANGTSRILVGGAGLGNNINVGTNSIAIDIIATETGPVGGDPDLSVTVLNNTSSQPDNNFTFTPGLRIDAQNNARLNANVSGNAFQTDPTCCGGSGIEIRELNSGSVRFQGFAGGDTTAATAFIDSNNPASSAPSFLFSGVDDQWQGGTAILPTPTTLPSP